MSYLEPKIRYMNSVSGSSAGNLPDAEEAYWGYLEENGPPAPEPEPVAWADITGKPTTFPPTIGTTSTTAMAGNTALLAIGTTATTAMAGNKTPTSTQRGGVLQAQAQADSVATDVAGLLADFNALLAKLRTAGVIASA